MNMQEFLAQAIGIELAAENAYHRLAGMAVEGKNLDAGEFFNQMAEYSRMHRLSIMRTAGMTDLPTAAGTTAACEIPEVSDGLDAVPLNAAMEIALAAELRGVEFYASVAEQAEDGQLKALAESFADEEREHVVALRRFMGQMPY